MEMTIEEADRILSNGLVNAPSEHEWCMAFKMAVEIMPKYQKIVEITKSWWEDDGVPLDYMMKVKKVIEDENDN